MSAIITSVGAVTGHGLGIRPLLSALAEGKSAIGPVTRFSTEGLCSRLGVEAPPDEALIAAAASLGLPPAPDRATRLLLAAAAEALEGRRFCPSERRGVVVGTAKGAFEAHREAWRQGHPATTDALLAPALALAQATHARGPVRSLGAACASSTAALGEALALIEDGLCDEVVVGGTEALHAFVYQGFHALKALSPLPASPFDGRRQGLSLGEGAAVLRLCRPGFDDGLPVATLRGYGSASDGHDQTAPEPKGAGLLAACRQALARAGVEAKALGRYHAHGTATLHNDRMEAAVYASLFGDRPVPLCAVKGSIGHTLGAAGALDVVACALSLGKFLPPIAHLTSVDPAFRVAAVREVGRLDRQPLALVATAGFGGINAAVVLEAGVGR